jgi:hypothetical protein
MRDLQRDWLRWSRTEKVAAGILLILPLSILPALYALGLPLIPHVH